LEKEKKKPEGNTESEKKITQEEMMKEAIYTEIANLQSLEYLKQIEFAKTKDNVIRKEKPNYPKITTIYSNRYGHSFIHSIFNVISFF
jgi:hypothetical protein